MNERTIVARLNTNDNRIYIYNPRQVYDWQAADHLHPMRFAALFGIEIFNTVRNRPNENVVIDFAPVVRK